MTNFARCIALAAIMTAGSFSAHADSAGATFSTGDKFTATTGEGVYASLCQACHMDQGQGAIGAGKYPALAKNENLEEPSYAIYLIINGQKGMPGFGSSLSDEQIAAVVGYIRTSFGNDYKEPVSAEDVAGAR